MLSVNSKTRTLAVLVTLVGMLTLTIGAGSIVHAATPETSETPSTLPGHISVSPEGTIIIDNEAPEPWITVPFQITVPLMPEDTVDLFETLFGMKSEEFVTHLIESLTPEERNQALREIEQRQTILNLWKSKILEYERVTTPQEYQE